jgi:hypothetical protein
MPLGSDEIHNRSTWYAYAVITGEGVLVCPRCASEYLHLAGHDEFTIGFECEGCDGPLVLRLDTHKGRTFCEWSFDPVLADGFEVVP